MKTFYAIASRFAGPGIGRTASHAALGLWRAGHLRRLVAMGHEPTNIDASVIHDVGFLQRGLLWGVSDKAFFELKNRWFDRRCRALLSDEFQTFHCWNSQATRSLEQAGRLGLKTVVDRASSHIRTQTEILEQQYARHGIAFAPTYQHVIRRCERDYELADIVTTPSPFAYRSFARRGFDMGKVVYNPFGVDAEHFAPRIGQPDEFRVVFAGQVGIRKGVPLLPQAWDRLGLTNARLILAGAVEPAAQPLLEKWGNRDDIVFAGYLERIHELLASCSVFAFPSCEEGSALVTYEAMACALPVIATENAGSLVADGVSGFVVPFDDPQILADRIEQLYLDRDRGWEMGQAARKQIEAYPWEAYGDRTARMHEGLAAGDSIEQIHQRMGVAPPEL